MESRPTRRIPGRFEFVGKIAPENVREKYVDKSVTRFFSPGNTDPIKYEGEAFVRVGRF